MHIKQHTIEWWMGEWSLKKPRRKENLRTEKTTDRSYMNLYNIMEEVLRGRFTVVSTCIKYQNELEQTNPYKLSSDLHMSTHVHSHMKPAFSWYPNQRKIQWKENLCQSPWWTQVSKNSIFVTWIQRHTKMITYHKQVGFIPEKTGSVNICKPINVMYPPMDSRTEITGSTQ